VSLAPGTRIGPYQVIELIGAGGMGEVYRATDTDLKRPVAIKVLPDGLSTDSNRLARFRREAEVLAALNHANIAHIHGLHVDAMTTALVMELVDGPTLAERISRGVVPVDESIRLAMEIAEALEAAHDRGIIHRDLKPANVKIRSDGHVKVLDFGLAKTLEPAASASMLAQAPTLTSAAMTGAGVILGTAAYMSPEQARGGALDKRTDIWAFGCVLYEMLTGRRAFPGETVSDAIAAVLEREPNWDALPATALPLQGVVRRCLEKNVDRRLRDISDVRQWLEEVASDRTRVTAPPAARSHVMRWTSVGVALGLAIGAAATGLLMRQHRQSIPVAARFVITASQSGSFTADTFGPNIAIAPDGSRIAYTVIHNGVPALAVRRLDSLEETPLAGTEGGTFPFFSPDSKQIGYATLEAIKRVPADGGASVTISPTDAGFRGATWGVDDTIVFARDGGAGLLRLSASGGKPQTIAAPDAGRGEENYLGPVLLPHSDTLLYTVVMNGGQTRVAARKLGGRDAITLAEGGIGPQYMAPGYVIFAEGERLMAIRFNSTTLATMGSPVAVQENAFTKIGDGVANLAVAGDGTAVFIAGHNPGSLRRLAWVTRKGEQVGPAFEEPVEYARNPRISPDGHKVALTVGTSGHADIWVYDLDRAAQPLKLTSQNHNTFPSWSADGKRIVFVSISTAGGYMFSIASDGSVLQPQRVVNGEAGDLPLAMAPEGASLLFRRNDDLWQLDLHDYSQRALAQTPFSEHSGSFSPNGHWIAYSSNQTGRMEIWVRPIASPGAPLRVSSAGGHDPVWSRDGKEIFFENSGTLMSAHVLSDAPLRLASPEIVLAGGFAHDDTDPGLRFFDAAPDGRLLVVEPATGSSAASVVLLQHWDQELNRLLPAQ